MHTEQCHQYAITVLSTPASNAHLPAGMRFEKHLLMDDDDDVGRSIFIDYGVKFNTLSISCARVCLYVASGVTLV